RCSLCDYVGARDYARLVEQNPQAAAVLCNVTFDWREESRTKYRQAAIHCSCSAFVGSDRDSRTPRRSNSFSIRAPQAARIMSRGESDACSLMTSRPESLNEATGPPA